MKQSFAFLFTIFSLGVAGAEIPALKILSWWDYLDPQTVNSISNGSSDPSITTYSQNDEAITKLSARTENPDVVILSGLALKALKNHGLFLDDQKIAQLARTRDYYSFLKADDLNCLPYLWSSTAYYIPDSEKLTIERPIELRTMLSKSAPFPITVLDEPLEIARRVLVETSKNCLIPIDGPESKKCAVATILDRYRPEHKRIFFNNDLIEAIAKHPKNIVYGWSGALIRAAKKTGADLVAPETYPSVDIDYVCVMNTSEAQRKRAVDFVIKLTAKKLTRKHARKFQYFSPYKDQEAVIDPIGQKLLKETLLALKKTAPLKASAPSMEMHRTINSWWRKIKFEK